MKNTKIILIFLSLFLIYGLFLFINKNNLEYKQLDFTSSKNINKCNQKEKDLKVQKTLKPNNSKVLDYVFENFETESSNNITYQKYEKTLDFEPGSSKLIIDGNSDLDKNGCINKLELEDAKKLCNNNEDCNGFYIYDDTSASRVCFKNKIGTGEEIKSDYNNSGFFIKKTNNDDESSDNESEDNESSDNESSDNESKNKPEKNISNNLLGVSDDTSLSLSKNNKSLNLNYSEYNNIKDYVNLYNSDLREKHKQELEKDFNSLKDTKNSLSNDRKLLKEKEDELQKLNSKRIPKKYMNPFFYTNRGIRSLGSFFR